MIRSGLYHLARVQSPSKSALAVAKPAAVVMSGKLSASAFSTRRKKHQKDKILVDATDDDSDSQRFPTRPFRPFFASGFGDFFARDPFFARRFRDPFSMDVGRIMPVLENFPTAQDMTLLRSSPGYEIKESETMYEIDIDIPEGVQASDMKVELEQNGTVLHVSGERKVQEENKVSHTCFDTHFTIGPHLDTGALTANFRDGVLVLKAPKLVMEEEEDEKQTIAITEDPHDVTNEEVRQTNYSDEFDESDWVETGKEGLKMKA